MNELTLPAIPSIFIMVCCLILVLIGVSLHHLSKNIKETTEMSEELRRVHENNDIFRNKITKNIKQLEEAYYKTRKIHERELSLYKDVLAQTVGKTDIMLKFIETNFSEKDHKFDEINKIICAVKDIKALGVAMIDHKSDNT